MQHALRRGCVVALLCGGVLMAGCGRTGGSSSALPSGAASAPTTPSASGQLSGGGRVTLTLDKSHYAVDDTVVVTIHNGWSQTIWAPDHQTSCSIVTAEQLRDGQWEGIQNCRMMKATRMVELAAGSTTSAGLSASQDLLAESSWSAGTYRVTCTYAGSDKGTGEPSGVAHSVQFTIG